MTTNCSTTVREELGVVGQSFPNRKIEIQTNASPNGYRGFLIRPQKYLRTQYIQKNYVRYEPA